MFEITFYSILSTVITTNVLIVLFIFLTSKEFIISKMPMRFTMFIVFVIIIRSLFPVEFNIYSQPIDFLGIMSKSFEILDKNIFNIYQYKFNISNILIAIWFIGIAISLFFYIKKYYIVCKKISYIPSTTDENILECLNKIKKKYNFNFDTTVIVNKRIEAPSEFGFFKQVIFLPSYLYQSDDIYYVLLHELIHFKNKSNWTKLFVKLTSIIFWWNPIIKLFENHVEFLLEVYTDKNVTREEDKYRNIQYLECLLRVYKQSYNTNSYESDIMYSLVKNLPEAALKKRFKIITLPRKVNSLLCAFTLFILFLYMFASYKYVIQPEYITFSYDLFMPKFNAGNSYILKDYLYYNGKLHLKILD